MMQHSAHQPISTQNPRPWPATARRLAARYTANAEPSLGDLMSDPIFKRLLASDGLCLEHVAEVIEAARRRLDLRHVRFP